MAVSKNNRRKGKKRKQNHAAPKVEQRLTEAQKQELEEKKKENNKFLKLSIVACVIMVIGFVIGWAGYGVIGYPISFVGAVMGLVMTRKQDRGRKVTIVCYSIYCVLVAYMWIFELMSR